MVTDAAETYTLLERCQQQDRAAFAELFNRYHLQVFRSAYLITRRQDAADDITQLVFVELFSAFHRFDLRRPFLPWLYRIVHNVSVDYLKRDRRGRALTPTTDAQFDILLGPDPSPGPAEQAEQAELRQTIWASARSSARQSTDRARALVLWWPQRARGRRTRWVSAPAPSSPACTARDMPCGTHSRAITVRRR